MITTKQLYNVLHDQFGLYAFLNDDVTSVLKMLEHPVPIHCLSRIAAANFWVPIAGVTRHNCDLLIPDSNLDTITTIYVTDLSKWIMFIQSNVDKDKAYAWEIRYDRSVPELRVYPFNKKLRDESWRVVITDRIHRHVQDYTNVCQDETMRYLQQHPVTPDPVGTASMRVTQRTASFAADWLPSLDPELSKMEEEIMKSFSTWATLYGNKNK
jgi:hypothetical protein